MFLPGKSHGQGSLAGYGLWGCRESDTVEWLKNKTAKVTLNHWLPSAPESSCSLGMTKLRNLGCASASCLSVGGCCPLPPGLFCNFLPTYPQSFSWVWEVYGEASAGAFEFLYLCFQQVQYLYTKPYLAFSNSLGNLAEFLTWLVSYLVFSRVSKHSPSICPWRIVFIGFPVDLTLWCVKKLSFFRLICVILFFL